MSNSCRCWILGTMLGCAETMAETTHPAPSPVVAAPVSEVTPAPILKPILQVVVDNSYMPWASSDRSVSATSKANRVDLSINVVPSHCSLYRSLTAVAKHDVLEVTLLRQEGAISPCTMTLIVEGHVDLPGPHDLQRVVVLDHDGTVLAQGPIKSAR